MESQPRFSRVRIWNICAAIVILGLTLPIVLRDSFHRSYRDLEPMGDAPGIPVDFPEYFIAGRIANMKGPGHVPLYYPPVGQGHWIYLNLRVDATTPYGSPLCGVDCPNHFVVWPFLTPPLSALVLAPLGPLRWQTAYFFWQVLCTFMIIASLYLALYLAYDRPPPIAVVAVGFALIVLSQPFKRILEEGNIDCVILFLWVLGAFWVRRGGPTAGSAACFALGAAVKINPIFAVPLFAIRRQWRWLTAYGAVIAALFALSIWKLGWENHVVWARQVAPILSQGFKSFWNRSLTSFIFELADPYRLRDLLPGSPGLVPFAKAVSGLVYASFLYWCWRKRRDSRGLAIQILLLPLIVLLISPISWEQNFFFAMPILAYLWARSREPAVKASTLDLILLTVSTLTFSSTLMEFHLPGRLGTPGDLSIMGLWIAATLAIVTVGMRMYGSLIADRQPTEAVPGVDRAPTPELPISATPSC